MLQKIVLTPGINSEGTDYSGEGGYYDCDKIRFRAGLPESIGGWVPYTTGVDFYGACYSMLGYATVNGVVLLAIGTHLKMYIEYGGGYYDITPVRRTEAIASNMFTTDTGTPTIIVVNDTAHGATTNDFVTITLVASAINGVPIDEINGEHQITVLTDDTYSFTITTAPSSSGTTGAGTAEYQLVTGLPYWVGGDGWGSGAWGRSTWGSGASVVSTGQLRLWGMANYGDSLVFGPRAGALYYLDYAGGGGLSTRGVLISSLSGANSVPTIQNGIMVSDQRFVIVFGSNDYGGTDQVPMLVRWSDQENYLEWEPTATTQAGSQTLTNGSTIITAKASRQEILIWTDTALHTMQFVGPPFIYGFTLLADNLSIMGPNAAVVINGIAYWMGKDKFYMYDGRVQTLPSKVFKYVYNNINSNAAWQVVAGSNEGFNEVWWQYPSADATLADRYVAFNYIENTWTYGTLDRTCWYDSALKSTPLAATYNAVTQKGNLYYHENGCDDGTTDPASAISSYVQSSNFDIGEGDRFSFVTKIIPDVTFRGSTGTLPTATITLSPRRAPGVAYGTSVEGATVRSATVPVEEFTEQVHVRVRGRQMNFRIGSNKIGTKWQMGAPRIDIKPDGRGG